jgi:predicted GNAT family acetyltransferase
MTLLDRPVWASLTTHHASLSEGNELARRFVRDVNLFASARDDSPAATAALGELVKPQESVFILQVPGIVVPAGLVEVKTAKGVQMLATRRMTPESQGDGAKDDEVIVPLTDRDAPEMLALATLTEPGPFLTRTHVMGSFLGIRIDGRLVAMAGERMRFPGYTEVSAVCTNPDFRGRDARLRAAHGSQCGGAAAPVS